MKNLLYNIQINLLLLYEKFCYKYCKKCGEIQIEGDCDFCDSIKKIT